MNTKYVTDAEAELPFDLDHDCGLVPYAKRLEDTRAALLETGAALAFAFADGNNEALVAAHRRWCALAAEVRGQRDTR